MTLLFSYTIPQEVVVTELAHFISLRKTIDTIDNIFWHMKLPFHNHVDNKARANVDERRKYGTRAYIGDCYGL